jgi:hypothetical protein
MLSQDSDSNYFYAIVITLFTGHTFDYANAQSWIKLQDRAMQLPDAFMFCALSGLHIFIEGVEKATFLMEEFKDSHPVPYPAHVMVWLEEVERYTRGSVKFHQFKRSKHIDSLSLP